MENKKTEREQPSRLPSIFTPRLVGILADEVAKTVARRLPSLVGAERRAKRKRKKTKPLENPIFLDTSAIIDGRIFDVISLLLFNATFVITAGVLRELKHIADSQDAVRRERGRKGLLRLEKLKKTRGVKMVILDEENAHTSGKPQQVDEDLIRLAKDHKKSKIITCDYNLEKKASIQNVNAINVNALAQILKVTAVPGEALHVKILHHGKDATQGVGYLDDGTMIVVEEAAVYTGRSIDVVIARVIQTATGRILFARKI